MPTGELSGSQRCPKGWAVGFSHETRDYLRSNMACWKPWTTEIRDFPIKFSMYRGFSTAMFDYQRASMNHSSHSTFDSAWSVHCLCTVPFFWSTCNNCMIEWIWIDALFSSILRVFAMFYQTVFAMDIDNVITGLYSGYISNSYHWCGPWILYVLFWVGSTAYW